MTDKELREYEQELNVFAHKAVPIATREMLNRTAFEAQTGIRMKIQTDFINRNTFVARSIQVGKAKGLNISTMESRTFAGFADKGGPEIIHKQEFGGFNNKSPGAQHGAPLPTSYSAGQGRQTPRTKLPLTKRKMENIRLNSRRAKGRFVGKRNLTYKVKHALDKGNRFIFHDFGGGRKKGIFRVEGGRKGAKASGWPKGVKIQMVADMTDPSRRIPKNPLFKPVVDKVEPNMRQQYVEAVQFQINRLNLFR